MCGYLVWQLSHRDVSANGLLESDSGKLHEEWEVRQGRETVNKKLTDEQAIPVGNRHSILLGVH